MRVLIASMWFAMGCEPSSEDTCEPTTPPTQDTDTGPALGEGNFSEALPFVVSTVPQSGDSQVDPAITDIRVTFSEPMDQTSYSWVQREVDLFPESSGARFVDDHTAVLDVVLEPKKTYEIWINGYDYWAFQSVEGEESAPYTLVFRTRDSD